MSKSIFFPSLFIIICLFSCNSNPLEINVDDVSIDYSNKRMDLDIYQLDCSDKAKAHQYLYQNYGDFYAEYIEGILALGPADSIQTISLLESFIKYKDTQETFQAITDVHEDKIEDYNKGFNDAFKHFKYYFPNSITPEVIYFNSAFNYSVYPTQKELGIGLDYFLGPDHPIVLKLDPTYFPQYYRDKMNPDYVVSDGIKGWLMVHHQHLYDDANLLSELMFYGKMMYLLDATMPSVPDHIKMNYTPEELEWCKTNERDIWIELRDQSILYNTNPRENERWTSDGPFTKAANIPQESPSRLGIWMGWQFVRDYMAKNEECSINDLLNNTNYIGFLNTYRPE